MRLTRQCAANASLSPAARAPSAHIVDLFVQAGAEKWWSSTTSCAGGRENLSLGDGQRRRPDFVEGDIRDPALVDELTRGIDLVFHQAAIRITQCVEEPRLALEVLVDGTFNVVEAAVEAGVRKVVAASSASVYGLAEEFPTDEHHHPTPTTRSTAPPRRFNEGLLRSFHATEGLDYVALRYFNVYGPRMDIHGVYTEVLVRWMERIAAGCRR